MAPRMARQPAPHELAALSALDNHLPCRKYTASKQRARQGHAPLLVHVPGAAIATNWQLPDVGTACGIASANAQRRRRGQGSKRQGHKSKKSQRANKPICQSEGPVGRRGLMARCRRGVGAVPGWLAGRRRSYARLRSSPPSLRSRPASSSSALHVSIRPPTRCAASIARAATVASATAVAADAGS